MNKLFYYIQDGTSHYMKGLVLLLCYFVIGACFFVNKTPFSKCHGSFYVSALLDHRVVRYLFRHYFWACLWWYFWVWLTLELVDWVKQIDLYNAGWLIQSTEDINRKEWGTHKWKDYLRTWQQYWLLAKFPKFRKHVWPELSTIG